MLKADCFELGYISKLHGFNGAVTIVLDVDFPEDYETLEQVFIEVKGQLVPYFIESFNLQQGNKAIVEFEEVNTEAEAMALKGSTLYLPLAELPELDEEGFYFHELQGLTLIDERLGEVGEVKEVINMPHQDLLSFDYQGNEVLVPIVDEIIRSINREKKELHILLPEGLLEVYTQASTPDDDAEDDIADVNTNIEGANFLGDESKSVNEK